MRMRREKDLDFYRVPPRKYNRRDEAITRALALIFRDVRKEFARGKEAALEIYIGTIRYPKSNKHCLLSPILRTIFKLASPF